MNNDFMFNDDVIIVTGASSGIGKATAKMFLERGATVILVARNEKKGQDAQMELKMISSACEFVSCDVSDHASVKRLFSYVDTKYGKLDVLHNNAAVSVGSDLINTTEEQWDATLNVNLKGAFLCSQNAAPLLQKGNRKAIVNTISELGIVATKNSLAYIASKGGLIQLTRAMALELADHHIRVNGICPAATESEMLYKSLTENGEDYEENVKRIADSYPLKRIAKPEDIAPAVLFLASNHASFITGQFIVLDGGFTAK